MAPPKHRGLSLLGLQAISDFGDQITLALLALCILDITNSTGKVGFVYFITTIGFLLFTLIGGVVGDKLSRRHVLLFADLGRGIVVLFMILALHEKSIALIYVASFLLAVLGALHNPVKLSTWAETIPAESLERYNSLSELSIHASTVVGPLIASFFILQQRASLGFAFDAMTFFICGVAFYKIVANKPKSIVGNHNKRDLFRGFKLIGAHRDLAQYISYDAIQMIGFGAFNATFVVLAQRDFGWSKIDYSYHLSFVAALTAVGALVGALPSITKINATGKLVGGALISAIAFFVALKIKSFPISSLLIGICDGIAVLTIATTRTKIQLFAKNEYPEFISSILAARGIIIKAATLFGVGACLIIEDFLTLEATLMVLVIPIALSALPLVLGNKIAIAETNFKAATRLQPEIKN